MNKQDLWDIKYDIINYAGEGYDNALSNLSFERDFKTLLELIKDPEDNLTENFKINKEELIEFLTKIRDGIDKWLQKGTHYYD
jgi:hypothetical protein